ncbi:MAG: ABC transporter ATP-binding protein [Candidatus Poribacteria bacterium]|nr:ABC transporter ATP-binding protein [Candidatus Poribacteria bacterium]
MRLNIHSITDKIVQYGVSDETPALYHDETVFTIYKCDPETAGSTISLQFGTMSKGNITLKNVTKCFGDTVAANDISLEIDGGEFFSLLGPSGCGKTTTLRMIGGFDHPTSGEILIDNVAIGRTLPYRLDVNTVFQNYALFPHKTVSQNIGFGLQMRNVAKRQIKAQVDEFLEMVRLPGYGDRKPSELSGGEKQRVALARALINRPSILLLDEPLAALDLKLRKQMQLELKELQREVGITFVYVTHDQVEAFALSDRVAIMNAGVVCQVGSAAEIYDEPNSRFVADFTGTSNFFDGRLLAVEGKRARVQLHNYADVELVCRHNPDLKEGDAVTVAIRPERIFLTTQPGENSLNRVKGIIRDEMYLGTAMQYTVEAFGGMPVVACQQNLYGRKEDRLQTGGSVYLTWHSENATVLPASDSI